MKTLWALPLLSALFAASCVDPMSGRKMSDTERDARSAICALCMSVSGLILVKRFTEPKL